MVEKSRKTVRMTVSSALKARRLPIKSRPRLAQFLLISLGLHLLAGLIHYLIPEKVIEKVLTKPIKVRFLPLEPKMPKEPTFIQDPGLGKKEAPKTDRLISHFDSKAHSNVKSKEKNVYKDRKEMIPKSAEVRSEKKGLSSEKSKPVKKRIPLKTKKQVPKKKMPELKIAKLESTQPKGKRTEPRLPSKVLNPIGVLAMLENLDTSKYASLGNGLLDVDDDELISLGTKEVKYADYFSRIKLQIEQVWTYPLEAARRGISGEITLKFKLSNGGDLVGVRMVTSSGTKVLDRAALQAVKKAAPYYPFPPEINKEKITILATFIYRPTYSNTVSSYR